MENEKEFIHFQADSGTKIIARNSIAAMEDMGNLRYKITLKVIDGDGKNVSFFIAADYSHLLQLFGGHI
jgi:hypothetical protein